MRTHRLIKMTLKLLFVLAVYFLNNCVAKTGTLTRSRRSILDFIDDGKSSGITFYLYNREHCTMPLKLSNCDTLDPMKKTIFIIHGWTENALTLWYKEIVDQYLIKGDFQVIAVDWQPMATKAYPKSVIYTRKVGLHIGTEIVKLIKTQGFSPRQIHLVGFSLGAHVAGFAGKTILKKAKCKVGRITGIDPAGPLFEFVPSVGRLDRKDAEWVEVMHCNAGLAGIKKGVGTRDFYVNGGFHQPKCVRKIVKNPFSSADAYQLACSHTKCPWYFAKTINHSYTGRRCASWILFTTGLCKHNPRAIFGAWKGNDGHGRYYIKI